MPMPVGVEYVVGSVMLVSQVGGTSNQFIDPNWNQNVTREMAAWIDTELLPNFGVRTGLVWRADRSRTRGRPRFAGDGGGAAIPLAARSDTKRTPEPKTSTGAPASAGFCQPGRREQIAIPRRSPTRARLG